MEFYYFRIVDSKKKYSLNAAHELFIRSLLVETNWSGGYFDEAHGNLQTNLSEEAIGYFSASSILIDAIIVKK